jgi:hypothetical protein
MLPIFISRIVTRVGVALVVTGLVKSYKEIAIEKAKRQASKDLAKNILAHPQAFSPELVSLAKRAQEKK